LIFTLWRSEYGKVVPVDSNIDRPLVINHSGNHFFDFFRINGVKNYHVRYSPDYIAVFNGLMGLAVAKIRKAAA
jgi:hypothetical protein